MADSKTLRVGLISPVENLHPWKNVDFVNIIAAWQVFETPFMQPLRGQDPIPVLFAGPLRRESSATGKACYSGQLREDVHFSDGTLLTAEHMAASLRRNTSFCGLADISVRGDRVFFQTKSTTDRLDTALVTLDRAIVLDKGGYPLGTGAYMRAHDSTRNRLLLVRNPHYRQKVPIERIEFKVYPREEDGQPKALLEALRSGEVDYTSFLLREEILHLNSVRKSFAQGSSTALLFFNTSRPTLRNPEIRQALARAIDRKTIAATFHSNPLAYMATSIIPPNMDQFSDGIRFDPKAAHELLERGGTQPPSAPLTMMVIWGQRPYLSNPVKAAEMIANQLGELGFQIRIEPTSNIDEYFNRAAMGDYDLALGGWIPDTPYSIDTLEVIYSSTCIPGAGVNVMNGINLGRLKSPLMDTALANYRNHPNSRNKEILTSLMRKEMPVLGIMYGPQGIVSSWRVKNISSKFPTQPYFRNLDLSD